MQVASHFPQPKLPPDFFSIQTSAIISHCQATHSTCSNDPFTLVHQGHTKEISMRYRIISASNGLRLCQLPCGDYSGKAQNDGHTQLSETLCTISDDERLKPAAYIVKPPDGAIHCQRWDPHPIARNVSRALAMSPQDEDRFLFEKDLLRNLSRFTLDNIEHMFL
jgi:hypothetical protein